MRPRQVLSRMAAMACLLCGVLLVSSAAFASTFTFNAPIGTLTSNGESVSAGAKVSISKDNYIDISLWNATPNVADQGQILTGLQLVLKDQYGNTILPSFASLSSMYGGNSKGTIRQLNPVNSSATGPQYYTYTDNTNQVTDWGTTSFSSGLQICAGDCSLKPEGLIGTPNSSGQYYVNPSVVGVHGPNLYGTSSAPVTFHVYAAGVTSSTVVSNANFLFGTHPDYASGNGGPPPPPPPPPQVPEPATITMMAGGIAVGLRKLRAKMN